jgi:hypothetical protein
MKKFSTILIVFMLFSGIAPASAAIKAGSKCLSAEQKQTSGGKQFTCVKSGKKLIWSSGVVMGKFIPWSTPINQNQELTAFRDQIDQWFKSNSPKNVELKIFVDPVISPSEIPWITKALTFEANYIGLPSTASYKIYIGKSDEWVINKRREVTPGLETWNPKYVCYDDLNEACASPDSQDAFFIWSTSLLSSPAENWQFTRSLGHEFFHITQCDLIVVSNGCGEFFNTLPSWLAEGGPNVIGAIFMDRLGYLNYDEQRKTVVAYYKNGKLGGNQPLSAFSENIRNGDLNPYEIGMLASEYLIASAGLQPFLDFYSNLPKSKNFDEAFQKSFRISVNDFYLAFDKARANLGFYPVIKK